MADESTLSSWAALMQLVDHQARLLDSYKQELAVMKVELREWQRRAVTYADRLLEVEAAARLVASPPPDPPTASLASPSPPARPRQTTACQRCHAPFDYTRARGGRTPKYCPPCRAQVKSENIRRRMAERLEARVEEKLQEKLAAWAAPATPPADD